MQHEKIAFAAERVRNLLLLCSILTAGVSESCLLQARAQTIWDNADTPKDPATPLVWKMPVESGESFAPPLAWDFVPDQKKMVNNHQRR